MRIESYSIGGKERTKEGNNINYLTSIENVETFGSLRMAIVNKHYVVFEDGQIFRYLEQLKTWIPLKQRLNSTGYFYVRLDRKQFFVHRVVAMCFCENPCMKKEVNHKDGNKQNNNVQNLEWVTRSENLKHAVRIGLVDRERLKRIANNEKSVNARKSRRKFTDDQVREIRKSNESDYTLGKKYGVQCSAIYQIRHYWNYKDVV